jgi:signal transduction histidine kinase
VQPHTLIQIAADGLRSMAEKKEVTIRTVVDNDDPISADADKIVQVLTNLISNAIKFAPEKSTVQISVLKARNLRRMRFLVSDQGPGIQPSDVHKLFSKFGQLAAGRTMKGTGLGLAISKAIVEQHKGEINLESKVGEGTTFWFELPCSLEIQATMDEQLKTVRFAPLKSEDLLESQHEQVETNA